jgi:hypothetical protein
LSVSSNSRAGGTLPNNSFSWRNRRTRFAVEREAELRLEARRAQHANRILAVACDRIADQLETPRADVLDAARVVPDREVRDVVVQRVGREIAAPDVVVDGAVGVVAQDAAVLVGDAILVFVVAVAGARVARSVALAHRRVAVEARLVWPCLGEHQALVHFGFFVIRVVDQFVIDVVVEIGRGWLGEVLVDLRRAHGAERGDLDDLATEEHMRQPESATDEPAVAERAFDFFRRRAGGDVEILRRNTDQKVAYAAADEEGLVAGLAQAIEHTQGIRRDRRARYGMFGTGDDACFGPVGRIQGGQVVQVFKVPLGR